MGKDRSGESTGYPTGQVARLVDLVDYREGSVVSRTLLKREAGNVTLFAFDRDQGLSEHTAPFDALVLMLDGEARITLSGNPHRLGIGDMILLPAGVPHAVSAVSRFKMMLVMMRG
jgi:quercetin dioxygenase-like cupin family protein